MIRAAWLFALASWSAPALAQTTYQNVYVPASTVAFEDIDVTGSDEDTNDLVLRFNKRCRVSLSGDLVEEEIRITPVAAGASKDNALYLAFPGVPTSVIVEVDATPAEKCGAGCGAEVEILPSFRAGFDGNPSGFVNTDPNGTPVHGKEFRIVATYGTPPNVGVNTCPDPAFQLRRPGEGVVIDADTTLDGQPLMGVFPGDWHVPGERIQLSTAYPSFMTWLTDVVVNGCVPGSCAAEGWFTAPAAGLVVDRSADLDTTARLQPAADCEDGTLNQDETGVDCGGDVCGPCLPTCAPGYFVDVVNATCEVCHGSCVECTGALDDQCTACNPGTYLSMGRCGTTCPAGSYPDAVTNTCAPCADGCASCVSETTCLSCEPGRYLDSGTCPSCLPGCVNCDSAPPFMCDVCESGYFADNGMCMPCIADCAVCTDAMSCAVCEPGYRTDPFTGMCTCDVGTYRDPYTNTCEPSCPSGHLADDFSGTCTACHLPCDECSGSLDACTSCRTGYFLSGSTCVLGFACPMNTYPDPGSGRCETCADGCAVCASATSCISCEFGWFHDSATGACVASCPSGTYESGFGTCEACLAPCDACEFAATNCVSCQSGYFQEFGSCMSCAAGCESCFSFTSDACTACTPGNFLYGTSCAPSCPDGTFGDVTTGLCQPCSSACETCFGPNNGQCTACRPPYTMVGDQCVPS